MNTVRKVAIPTLLTAVALSLLYWGYVGNVEQNAEIRRFTDDQFYASVKQVVASSIEPLPRLRTLDVDLESRVALGRILFSDPRLSRNGQVSCFSCHVLQAGGHDPRGDSVGVSGKKLPRNSPTVLNAAFNMSQFWDGRAADLIEQAEGPLFHSDEMASDRNELIERLQSDPGMVKQFSIYPQGITVETVIDAIALFERTLITPNAPFDRYLQGEENAITESEKAGYRRFKELGCISCHQGRNIGGNLHQKIGIYLDDNGSRRQLAKKDTGRFSVTGKEEDRFVFKVPSLRNVARTAPYFHDGSRKTLKQAIRDMGKLQLGRELDEMDVELLHNFLQTLTGEVVNPP